MSFIRNALSGHGMPPLSSFAAVNAGGRATTAVADAGGIQMLMSNGVAADDFRILKMAAPIPPYTLTVHVFSTLWNANYSGCGLIWRASSTGNIQTLGYHSYINSMNLLIRNESANNNGASPTFTTGSDLIAIAADVVIAAGPGIWFQLHDDGTTNRVFRFSNDGQTFQTLVTTGRTTTITPDEVGIFIGNVNNGGSAPNAAALFDSWRITS
jgi:hypothetical protein